MQHLPVNYNAFPMSDLSNSNCVSLNQSKEHEDLVFFFLLLRGATKFKVHSAFLDGCGGKSDKHGDEECQG